MFRQSMARPFSLWAEVRMWGPMPFWTRSLRLRFTPERFPLLRCSSITAWENASVHIVRERAWYGLEFLRETHPRVIREIDGPAFDRHCLATDAFEFEPAFFHYAARAYVLRNAKRLETLKHRQVCKCPVDHGAPRLGHDALSPVREAQRIIELPHVRVRLLEINRSDHAPILLEPNGPDEEEFSNLLAVVLVAELEEPSRVFQTLVGRPGHKLRDARIACVREHVGWIRFCRRIEDQPWGLEDGLLKLFQARIRDQLGDPRRLRCQRRVARGCHGCPGACGSSAAHSRGS